MRIPIRTSRLAVWARRLGAFAVPLLVLGGVLHLLEIVDSATFEIVLVLVTMLGALTVLLALTAYVRIWYSGDLGWGKASMGLLAGLLALGPLFYSAFFALSYPSTADISTDSANPPVLALRAGDAAATPLEGPNLAGAFPGIVARSYAIAPEQVYALLEGLVEVRGWSVLRRQGPVTNDGTGVLNVREVTLLGWDHEFAFRVAPAEAGTRLDLRAASVRDSVHDLGHNGRVVQAFLADLDAVVAIFERDAALAFEQGGTAAVQIGD